MADSLKNKTINGISWSFLDNIANSGITFLVGLILARILNPEEYGIMAILMIFIAVSNSIVDSGFSNALIRKLEVNNKDYNTVFFFNLIVSIILYVLLFLFSSYISVFFREPLLTNLLRVMGIILIINALAIIPRTIFVRNVDFKIQTKVSLFSSIFSGIVGICMAIKGFGVWSLVWQQISRQFINTFLLWLNCTWRPQLVFSKLSFFELFGFGSKLLISGLIDTIYKEFYSLVIGRFYKQSDLGQYTRANQFNMIFSSNLTAIVQRVSYPVLSSIQNEENRLKEVYRSVIKSTMLVSFMCMLGLAAIAKPFVLILIGEKWLPSVYYLQIICFSGMMYPLHAINLNILQVKGRSDIFLKLEIIKKILGLFPIIIGILYGIDYMLWGSVIMSIVSFYLNSYYSAPLINYSSIKQLMDILPSFLVSLFVSFIMWLITFLDIPNIFILIIQCVIGAILFIVINEYTSFSEYVEIKNIIKHKFFKKNNYGK